MNGRPILTAEEMAAAEQAAIDAGTPVEELMERAGRAVADQAWRMAGPGRTLVLCGPGNNGGDGYVAARLLDERGCEVTVAALTEPKSDAARQAREGFAGRVVPLDEAGRAPLVIDALFGTGLARPLDDDLAGKLAERVSHARHSLAIDLPSGVETDSGALLSPVPAFDATVALGALKPAHLLQPAAGCMGMVLLGEIGIVAESSLTELAKPELHRPAPGDHKYSRGYVLVAAGEMAGASALTASAALRAGAGYVVCAGDECAGLPHAVIQRDAADGTALAKLLEDDRIDVVAIGPGLGRSDRAETLLDAALVSGRRLVLDADALTLLGDRRFADADRTPILTPHAGEFDRLFGGIEGSKLERARKAAAQSGAVIVFKGNDTVIAAPDGRGAIAPAAPTWLASAGTGDVLTGVVAARYAQLDDAFEAACQAVWLHAQAGRRAGPFLIADDVVAVLPAALAGCLTP